MKFSLAFCILAAVLVLAEFTDAGSFISSDCHSLRVIMEVVCKYYILFQWKSASPAPSSMRTATYAGATWTEQTKPARENCACPRPLRRTGRKEVTYGVRFAADLASKRRIHFQRRKCAPPERFSKSNAMTASALKPACPYAPWRPALIRPA